MLLLLQVRSRSSTTVFIASPFGSPFCRSCVTVAVCVGDDFLPRSAKEHGSVRLTVGGLSLVWSFFYSTPRVFGVWNGLSMGDNKLTKR